MKLFGSALALALAAPVMAQQQDFSAVKIETQQLAPGLFMLMGSGGNMALSIGPDGAVLVDTEYAPLNAKILAAVKQAGGGAVKYVVNTHWHGDHTGGNEPLGKAGAQIIAHNNVRVRMSSEQFMAAFNNKIPPSPAAALPTVTFPTRATFHWNGNTVNVVHVNPAHTDGDSIVHFTNANVIHTGDTFVKDQYPFIDLSSNGSIDGIIGAAEGAGWAPIRHRDALHDRASYRYYWQVIERARRTGQRLPAEIEQAWIGGSSPNHACSISAGRRCPVRRARSITCQ